MLIVDQNNCTIKLLYNPYSKITFTLKNLKNNQVYGQGSIVMRMLKGLRGKQSQILPMNGNTYDEILPDSGFKPNIELEYKWNNPVNKNKTQKETEVFNSGIREASKKLRELIDQLMELLNTQQEIDEEVNEEFIQYLESKISAQVQKIEDQKEAAINELHGSRAQLEETKKTIEDNETIDIQTATEIDIETNKVGNLITLLDANTEEAKKRNLEIRK